MKRFIGILSCLLMLSIYVFCGQALASTLDWKMYETEHFVVFFHEGNEFQAQETAYYLEQQLPRIIQITGNDRNFKTRIVIQDIGIESNGYTNPFFNKIGIYTNSPTNGDLSGYQNWFRLVSGHEETHMRQILNYSGSGAVMPTILGNIFAPNLHVPGWIIEGITVYNESQISPYEVRLNDGYYDAILAAKVRAGKFPSILEANYLQNYFPIGQHYLFGGTFMRYLANTYGEEKIAEFFNVQGQNFCGFLGGFIPDLGINQTARQVFGKPFDKLFEEWEAYEIERNKGWRIDGEMVVANTANGFIDNLSVNNGKLYYTKRNILSTEPGMLGDFTVLAEYDPATNKEKVLKELPVALLAKAQLQNNKIYYLSAEIERGFSNLDQMSFGATGILCSYDLQSRKTSKIFSDELKAFVVMENGDFIYAKDRKDIYGAEIWRYIDGKKIKLGNIDQKVSEIKAYGDRLILVSKKNLGGWNINFLNLSDLSIEPIVDTPWAEKAIVVEGETLYYTANYGNQYGLYAYDLSTQEVSKLTVGGYASNGVLINDTMYFKGITADGEAIFKKDITPVPYQLTEREVITLEPIAEFAANLEEKNGFMKNLSYMLIPSFRMIPFYFSGEDGLGTNKYAISYSNFGGYDFSLTTTLAQPLQVSIVNQKVSKNGRETVVAMNYPVYVSSQYGLSSVNVSALTNVEDTIISTVSVGFYAPHQYIDIAVSGKNNGGINADLGYKYQFDQGNLSLYGSIFNKFDKTVAFRGTNTFDEADARGAIVSAEYTRKLANVRKGFWPSTLYLADIYGGVFADYTTLEGGEFSVGANVKLEVGLGFWLTTVPEIGVLVTSEGKVNPYFGFSMGF